MKIFVTANIHDKLRELDSAIDGLLNGKPDAFVTIPSEPARDSKIVHNRDLPKKPSLATPAGQARLLHDLASIELQAMELGLMTLLEYPEAPKEFREQLAEITLSEGRHLKLCLEAIDALGFKWSDWPVHVGLWASVQKTKEPLVHRILHVHRHMEGSGLDAGDSILRRLTGVESKITRSAVNVIVTEEVGHVEFGSRWYKEICRRERLDPEAEFKSRMPAIAKLNPRREKIAHELRLAAGFEPYELQYLEELQTALYS